MQLSKEIVGMFQALHREKHSEEISYDVAELQLSQLANLVRMTSPKQETKQNDTGL